MKKRVMALLLAGIIAGIAAACGGETPANTTNEEVTQTEAEVTPEEAEVTKEAEAALTEPETTKEAEVTPTEPEVTKEAEVMPAEPEVTKEAEVTPEEPTEVTPAEPEEESAEVNQNIPANKKCFMGGALFTNMQPLVTENYEDGTYNYQDLTEDGLTTIVNRSIVNNLQTGEDYSLYVERVIKENIQSEARDINIMGAGEQESIKGGLPTYYATWTSGGNEDTRVGDGVFVIDENYTYMYYFEIGIDWYEDMGEVFLDVMDGLELVEIMK